MAVVNAHKAVYSVALLCAGLELARASYYLWQQPSPPSPTERIHPRALSANERQDVLGAF